MTNNHTMNIGMAEGIVDLMHQCGAQKFCIIGGEPTLYDHLFRLIKYISNKGSKSTLLTNGIRLADYDYCIGLKESNLDGVNVSIKAIDSNSMKELTGHPDVNYLAKAVRNIKSAGLSNAASVVVSKYTSKSICEICEFLMELGFESIILSFCQPVLCSNEDFMIEKETLKDTVTVLHDFFDNYERINDITNGRFSGCGPLPICLYPKDILKKMLTGSQIDNGCIILSRRGIVYNPNGEVCICNHLQDFTLGRFGVDFCDEPSFERFWNDDVVRTAFERLSTPPKDGCLDCNKYKYCGGSCPLRWFQYSIEELEFELKKEDII